MTKKNEVGHQYQLGQICAFTNRGTSGITGNNGRRCKIVQLKPQEEWVLGEPGYVIHFLDTNHGFGVRESELKPVPSAS